MKLIAVDSSVIAAMDYDSDKRHLDMEYRQTGDIYRYFDVPPEEFQAFMAAESIGEYLNKVFKPRGYRFEIIRPGHKRTQSELAS